MSKIQHIKIQHLKSIDKFEADFKGCTCVITGKNNSGKSSFLRGIPDRIRFIRPDVLVKTGETEGRGEMVLSTGEKFIWVFNVNGKDTLTLITKEGLKQPVTVEIGKQYFPTAFDIDKFLQSPPKKQADQLQAIIGLDFTDIDARYEVAYDARTERNRDCELYHAKLAKMLKVDPVHAVDLITLLARKEAERTRLNALYLDNKSKNDKVREEWNAEKEKINKECLDWNKGQSDKSRVYNQCDTALEILVRNGYSGDASAFVAKLQSEIKPEKFPIEYYPKEPTYVLELPDGRALDAVDAEILAASQTNAEAAKYKEYIDHKKATANATEFAKTANELVLSIEMERQRMLESANMPKGIAITGEGITIDGLPLDKNQISTSKLYTSALRIASINLGEVRMLYFDASYLDRNNLEEIEQWAAANDLQLLIELVDRDGGDMEYQIVETLTD